MIKSDIIKQATVVREIVQLFNSKVIAKSDKHPWHFVAIFDSTTNCWNIISNRSWAVSSLCSDSHEWKENKNLTIWKKIVRKKHPHINFIVSYVYIAGIRIAYNRMASKQDHTCMIGSNGNISFKYVDS